MSVKSRLSQIKAQTSPKLVNGIVVRNKSYVVIGMRSLTNNAVNYDVKLVYAGKEKFSDVEYQVVECGYCQDGLREPCKGNKKTVCRHFLAAFMWANERKSNKVVLFDTFSDAMRYVNFGGSLVKLVSGKAEAWAVVRKAQKETMAERVNLMRGPVEMGID